MKPILSSIIIFIFFGIALIHFYWAIGGKKGMKFALPELEDKSKSFKPGVLMTFAVGVFFAVSCFVFYSFAFRNIFFWNQKFLFFYLLIIAIVFLARAYGDMKYVGLFKKISHTGFAKMDSKYYTPLCIFMGLSILALLFI